MPRGSMLGVFREKLFSPGRVEDDAAILTLTAVAIQQKGFDTRLLHPEELTQTLAPQFAFAMCEGSRYLDILQSWETKGYPVFNRPEAVQNCHRWKMLSSLAGTSIPIPEFHLIDISTAFKGTLDLNKGVWIKRWDVQSSKPGDVCLVSNLLSFEKALEQLRAQGDKKVILQEHISGLSIKFYGVRAKGWFRCLYDTGDDEAKHPVLENEVQKIGEEVANKMDLDIYGGDMVETDGRYYLIDINSWPSFAPCRQAAAEQIASYLVSQHTRWVNWFDV